MLGIFDPVMSVFVILPILSFVVGVLLFRLPIGAMLISLLSLFLLFIDVTNGIYFDMNTFRANLEIFLIYGIPYVCISFLGSSLMRRLKKK